MKIFLLILAFLLPLTSYAFCIPVSQEMIKYDQRSDPSFRYKDGEIEITRFSPGKRFFIKERSGIDIKQYNAAKKKMEDNIAKVENQTSFWQNLIPEITALKTRIGKPITQESDIKIINLILKDEDLKFDKISSLTSKINSKTQDKEWVIWYVKKHKVLNNEFETRDVLYSTVTFEKMKSDVISKRNKDRNLISQDLQKGLISKKLKPHLNELLKRAENISKVAPMVRDRKISYIRQGQTDFSFQSELSQLRYPDNYTDEMMRNEYRITLEDTIINPLYKDFLLDFYHSKDYSALDKYDQEEISHYIWKMNHKSLDKGWEWVSDSKLKEKQESYPISVTYYYCDSLPQYRFKSFECYHGHIESTSGEAVFNERGDLIRIHSPWLWKPYYHYCQHLFPQALGFYQSAYKSNEYNIHSAGRDINHYIKVELKLEKRTAKEEAAADRAATKMANALIGSISDNIKYGSSSRGKRAQNKRAKEFLGGASQGYLKGRWDGQKWFQQIQDDYWEKYWEAGPYVVERIDDTSFRLIFVDQDLTPTFEMIIEYSSNGPYNVQDKIIIKRL